jgi:hypothetical protein
MPDQRRTSFNPALIRRLLENIKEKCAYQHKRKTKQNSTPNKITQHNTKSESFNTQKIFKILRLNHLFIQNIILHYIANKFPFCHSYFNYRIISVENVFMLYPLSYQLSKVKKHDTA